MGKKRSMDAQRGNRGSTSLLVKRDVTDTQGHQFTITALRART
jgi:hypothetical protein